jgi:3-methyladenine DNA glycosylase AlkD
VLVDAVRRALREHADPARAPQMQSYMKSAMPFLGVAATPLRAALKPLFAEHVLPDAETWRDTVLKLWREAKFREERYAAIELSGVKKYKAWQDLDALPMYQEMIVTGAWWDHVDVIATHRIGNLLEKFPAKMKKTMLAWSKDDDIWLRRTSILCQHRFKEKTDLSLLYACIEPSIEEKEFFLRKAIGWSLREHAKTDPAEVQRYVRENEHRLSGLSKREALKNV